MLRQDAQLFQLGAQRDLDDVSSTSPLHNLPYLPLIPLMRHPLMGGGVNIDSHLLANLILLEINLGPWPTPRTYISAKETPRPMSISAVPSQPSSSSTIVADEALYKQGGFGGWDRLQALFRPCMVAGRLFWMVKSLEDAEEPQAYIGGSIAQDFCNAGPSSPRVSVYEFFNV